MSTIFVLALLGVIWGFVRQAHTFMVARTVANAPASSSISATTPAAAAITLAPGARIISAATDAGKLVLHVDTPTGGEVEIVDLATGKLTGQVRTTPAVPSR
ncbi:MAG TPA: hypothetical protein VGM26_15535 [Rhizomicrobium sp.]